MPANSICEQNVRFRLVTFDVPATSEQRFHEISSTNARVHIAGTLDATDNEGHKPMLRKNINDLLIQRHFSISTMQAQIRELIPQMIRSCLGLL